MKLVKIYFDAYRSLLNKTLNVTNGCIGFVGINESGKSNLLGAVRLLSENKKLGGNDTPRMAKKNHPKVRFEFKLTTEEKKVITNSLNSNIDIHSLVRKPFLENDFSLIYVIEYNKSNKKEIRYFTLNGVKLNDDIVFLKPEKGINDYKIPISDKFIPLSEINIIDKKVFETFRSYLKNCKKNEEIESDLIRTKNELNELLDEEKMIDSKQENSSLQAVTEPPRIIKKRKELESFEKAIKEIGEKIGGFNLLKIIADKKEHLNDRLEDIETSEKRIKEIQDKINKIESVTNQNPQQKKTLSENQSELKKNNTELKKLNTQKKSLENLIDELEENFEDKFTTEVNVLRNYFPDDLNNTLLSWLPNVVYWEHSDSFILESVTLFEDILNKSSLNDLSRPLVNVFRICLGINDINDLKECINEIQTDESERSRMNDTFNRKFDVFLEEVWSDYDQKVKISLEENQIRIQFFDPECLSASYYSMQERSQGCQTFISFLLTIGAEAKKDVLKNSVLLLDEPETHLHPSGVRYMLNELIKISENDNIVLFATHSIFMIDRNNFNRHIILTKKKEHTEIIPSTIDRIGFFLQEEVLYGALNINLSEDFKSSSKFNFVFEGDGDAIMFKYFYEKILNTKERPFTSKDTSFYHGGGCSGIKKYFNSSPIHLGTKWIIVLDKDTPADNLKKIIEGRYRDYIKSDVFVFQYEKKELKELELEDILPKNILIQSYLDSFKDFDISIKKSDIESLISEKESFLNYNKVVIDKFCSKNKDDFKAKFKGFLNKRIENELKTEKEDFSKTFSVYYAWANNMVKDINESIK